MFAQSDRSIASPIVCAEFAVSPAVAVVELSTVEALPEGWVFD